jgi:enoyl-CoA hydratase/carnithine racemase
MTNVIYEKRNTTAIITLNREQKLNALSSSMMRDVHEALDRADSDEALRCVILTGAGERAFCAGTDISEIADLDENGGRGAAKRGNDVCNRIEDFRMPVIAAINGIAAGGGFELVLACHLRLAAAHATFSLPELKLGVIPGYGGSQRLAKEIGRSRAIELMLLSKLLKAADAKQIGLINRVIDDGNVLVAAEQMAKEIGELAPLAIRACLSAVTRGIDLPLAEGLELETELFASLFSTNDMREGTKAFLEKRKPKFTGR